MAKTAWESVVTTLKAIGTGTTRYGDTYTIYAWDKENHVFIEWWYGHTAAQRKAEGICAGMTPHGFGVRDLRNTSHAPKITAEKSAVKGKKSAVKAQPTADKKTATQPVTNWAELFNKQQAILSSLMDRMAEVESAVKALQPKRKTVKK